MMVQFSTVANGMHIAAPPCKMLKNGRHAAVRNRLDSSSNAVLMSPLALPTTRVRRRCVEARAGEEDWDEEAALADSENWEDEEVDGPDIDDFAGDMTITTNEDDNPDTLLWADYLAINVEGLSVPEIEAEERLAGVEVSTSPLAAAISAATVAAAAMGEVHIDELDAAPTSKIAPKPIVDAAVAAASASKFFERDTLSLYADAGPLTDWDLRAAMEKRRWMESERETWMKEKEESAGKYRALAADWRTDVRIKDTGDPTQAVYREWTLKEIWDMITLGGASVDPRSLPFKVESPKARTDFVADGFYQHPEAPEFLAMQGRLIQEADEVDVVDADAEALLASEFSDFDDFGGSGDAAAAAAADTDDGFSGEF